MLNHIIIMGRMVRDPQMRRTGSGVAATSFTVAVDRDFADKQTGEKETDFIDCVAWRQTGEFVNKYFKKGSMIAVSGRLQIRSWTDNEGNKRRASEIVADNCYFANTKKESDGTAGQHSSYSASAFPETEAAFDRFGAGGVSVVPESDFAMLEDDNSILPF